MDTSFNNEWFTNASFPFTDIAHMLMALDEKGVIPADMREAIYQHAENSVGTLPLCVAAASASLASAVSGNVGLEKQSITKAAWGIESLAEQIHGWKELEFCFGPENTKQEAGHAE